MSYGELVQDYSYVKVTKTQDGYDFIVQAKDTSGYCINATNKDNLSIDLVTKDCNIDEYFEYNIGKKIYL